MSSCLRRGTLHEAALCKSGHIVKYLLEQGMDANALNDLGKTPLHEAVEVNSIHVARLLLDSGADVNARDANGGWAPLHYAANMGTATLELTKLLLDYGADIEVASTVHGHTPLHHTVYRNSTGLARLLLENGANVNAVNAAGETPGDLAKKYGSPVYHVIEASLHHQEDK